MAGISRIRTRSHHSPRTWQLAALLLAVLSFLPSIALAQAPPAAPASVTLTRADGTVTADWPAVSGATKYHVTYSSNNRQSWSLAAFDHGTNSITISGADNAKTYVVGVRAGNAAGWSGWRNSPASGPYTPPQADPQPPGAPASITVTRSDSAITAAWPPVAGATGYAITYSAVGSGNWMTAATNHAGTSITISGVNNDHTYLVGASSRNKYGQSPSKVSPPSGPYSKKPPATPLSVTVLRADGELTAFWNSGFGAESYHVTYTSDNGKNWTAAASDHPVGNGITEITIKDLDNAKTYTVGVRARNKNGYSGWRNSAPSGPYVAIVAPPRPKNVKGYPSDSAVTFIWDKPVDLGDAEVTGYQAAYWLDPGDCASPETVQWYNIYGSNGDMVYYTMPGLTNGTKYGVALRAVNQGTPGPGVRACLTPIAGVNPPPFVPPAPESLNLIRGDGTLTVTWLPSRTATGYQVNYSTDGGNTWKIAAWWNATTSIILRGMDDATTYTVKVRGRNDRGDGPWSDAVTDRPASSLTVSNLGETNTADGVLGKDWYAHTSQAAGSTATASAAAAPAPGSRDAGNDVTALAAAGNTTPDGVWANGATLWVVDADDRKLYAYDLATKTRDPGKDVTLSRNTRPLGLASDGATLWVSDYHDGTVYAYAVSGEPLDGGQAIALHPDNASPSALWSDGATLWVAEDGDGRLYAYDLPGGARNPGRDVTLHADNGSCGGLWSDGQTMWVSDPDDGKVYAYRLSDGRRESSKDYLSGEEVSVYGLWSDGTTMWIADDESDRLLAHHAH